MKTNVIAMTAVISEGLRKTGGQEWVIHNKDFMALLGMSRKTFERTRSVAIKSEYITYECRGTSKAGVYALHSKWVDFTHMGNIYTYYIYNIYNNKDNIYNTKYNIYKHYGEKLPTVKITHSDFDENWPSLRVNDRSSKAQSRLAWEKCRKKFSAEQIVSAWKAKVASYSDKSWVCGFQVFAKPDNVSDFLSKPKPPAKLEFTI